MTFQEAVKSESGYEFYIEGGMYYKHLRKYYDIFPERNIRIFWVDDLNEDPVRFIQDVYKFLGVDNSFVPPSVRNRANVARQIRWKSLKVANNYFMNKFHGFLDLTRFYFIKDIAVKIGLQKMIHNIFYKGNVKPFKKPSLDPVTERIMRELFLEDIESLEKLTRRDLSSWKRRDDTSS